MVILMHAPYPHSGLSGLAVVPISLFTAPCIGLFFMVSGALLLPAKENSIDFMKKVVKGLDSSPGLDFCRYYPQWDIQRVGYIR